jgi:hypothetical protein
VTLDDLPEYLTLDYLEAHGLTREGVRRRCPHVVEYGPADAPYYHRDDLAELLADRERGDRP